MQKNTVRLLWIVAAIAVIALLGCFAEADVRSDVQQRLGVVTTVSVKDFGAVGDGVANDQAAIQAAIASGAQKIYFPSGVYLAPYVGPFRSFQEAYGDGESTIVRQTPGVAANIRLLYCNTNPSAGPVQGVYIHDMALDGNRSVQTPDEHRSGIFASNCPNLHIRNVSARYFTGDGFYVYNQSNGTLIESSTAEFNGRDGYVLGGGVDGYTLRKSRAYQNRAEQFDMEGGVNKHVFLYGNTLDSGPIVVDTTGKIVSGNDFAATITGYGVADGQRTANVELAGNLIVGGGLDITWSDDVMVHNNVINNHNNLPCVTAYRTTNRVTLEDNLMTSDGANVRSYTMVAVTGTGTGSTSTDFKAIGNSLTMTNWAQSFGFKIEGAISVELTNNVITGPGIPTAGYSGIYLKASNDAEDFQLAKIQGNKVSSWGNYGITVQGNDPGHAKILRIELFDNTWSDTSGGMTTAMLLDADRKHVTKAIYDAGDVLGGNTLTLWAVPAAYTAAPAGVLYTTP